ncbi:hypothetical protein [Mesorhizobium sp.]|uniref:hypothetical protein n=1 Tax=Mesorhizobium sp. TaxID=1871066 RepID=UPI000FE6DC57|nr:hypothetical protein [Mesorhizobium sp.]RWK46491.1 MAG: hypothetical protein EOR48_33330 [Mesorhizobium sp.]
MEITVQRGQHMLVLFLLIFGVTGFPLTGYRDGLVECLAPSFAQTPSTYRNLAAGQCLTR